jgi:uncharacterized protein
MRLPQLKLALIALLLLSPCAASAVGQPAALDHKRIGRLALEKHILPGYHRLAEAFAGVESSAAQFCASPTSENGPALRERFFDAVRAWGHVAHIGIGPVRDENRYERIWFWPDRKGIATRQVAGALKDMPADYLDPAKLAQKSIGVQGFGALEQILYPKDGRETAEPGEFGCAYLKAITANLKAISARMEADWQVDGTFGKLWLNPGLDNRSFLKDEEISFAVIRTLMENLERVRDAELARPLGVAEGRRVLPGPFDRSGATMIFIAARIDGLRSLLIDSGLAEELTRLANAKPDEQAVGDMKQALFELDFAVKRADVLARIPNILGDEARRSEAAPLGFPLRSGRTALANVVGAVTNLPVGYNASDGD